MTVRTGRVSAKAAGGRSSGERPAPQAGRGVNAILLILALVGSLHVFSMLGVEVWRGATSRSEIARLQADVLALEHNINGLQAVIDHAGDEQYREQLARCQGFVYPDETRYVTLLESPAPQTAPTPFCN